MHLLGGVILKVGIEGVVVHTGFHRDAAHARGEFRYLDDPDRHPDQRGRAAGVGLAGRRLSANSSPTGSVFLSAFTTKTAVLALILLFPGEPVLIWIGLYMIMYGIIYALLENDARRILAYSIVNQVGFMVCAVGIGTAMALNGAAAHAFAHIIYKALLFMSAGAVIYRTGQDEVHRARRPVPHDARDDGLRHRRCAGDLQLPADVRLYDQEHDLAGGRPTRDWFSFT